MNAEKLNLNFRTKENSRKIETGDRILFVETGKVYTARERGASSTHVFIDLNESFGPGHTEIKGGYRRGEFLKEDATDIVLIEKIKTLIKNVSFLSDPKDIYSLSVEITLPDDKNILLSSEKTYDKKSTFFNVSIQGENSSTVQEFSKLLDEVPSPLYRKFVNEIKDMYALNKISSSLTQEENIEPASTGNTPG